MWWTCRKNLPLLQRQWTCPCGNIWIVNASTFIFFFDVLIHFLSHSVAADSRFQYVSLLFHFMLPFFQSEPIIAEPLFSIFKHCIWIELIDAHSTSCPFNIRIDREIWCFFLLCLSPWVNTHTTTKTHILSKYSWNGVQFYETGTFHSYLIYSHIFSSTIDSMALSFCAFIIVFGVYVPFFRAHTNKVDRWPAWYSVVCVFLHIVLHSFPSFENSA